MLVAKLEEVMPRRCHNDANTYIIALYLHVTFVGFHSFSCYLMILIFVFYTCQNFLYIMNEGLYGHHLSCTDSVAFDTDGN